MATTLSYGYLQPVNGDRGSVWFAALNSNITQLNGHAHNGSDSAAINAANIVKGQVSIPSGSWVLDVTGRYKQDVTAPSGFNMDDYIIQFRISSGANVNLSYDRLTATTFRVYTCDNSQTFVAVFR